MIILQVRGGLGNQMFQYAFARTLSLNSNNESIYLYTENYKYDDLREFALSNLQLTQDIKIINKSVFLRIYRKIFLMLIKIGKIKENDPDDALKLYRFGFLQYLRNNKYIQIPKCNIPIKYFSCLFLNKEYFKEYENLIKKELLVKTKPSKQNEYWINLIKNTSNSVCVHIRRGDYVKKQKYLVCDENYYKTAVKRYREELEMQYTFFVFSEDISYAKSLQLSENNIFYIDLNNPDYEELRLMYTCNNFIISNSTFSWWAQYLAEDKNIVISPKFWSKEDDEISYMNEKEWILL